MCVIMAVGFWDTIRPTDLMVEKAWDKNNDGGGLAWREDAKGGKEVVWKKGIEDVEEMKELCKTLPLPYVAHFRVASCGGVRPSLTHPFPIDKATSNALTGRTKGRVLFHNGDWRGWAEQAREAAIRANVNIPLGKWSDSRAMAWLCSIYGVGFMEFLPEQKGVAFGPNDFEFFLGTSGWTKVNDVWCSNDYYMTKQWGQGTAMCKWGNCRSWNTDNKGYCPLHKDGVVQDISSLTPAAGGAQGVTPFSSKAPVVVPPISLELAERLHDRRDKEGKRLISKNLMKRIRGIYSDLAAGGKRGEKAKVTLQGLSRQLNMNGLVASTQNLIHMAGLGLMGLPLW